MNKGCNHNKIQLLDPGVVTREFMGDVYICLTCKKKLYIEMDDTNISDKFKESIVDGLYIGEQ